MSLAVCTSRLFASWVLICLISIGAASVGAADVVRAATVETRQAKAKSDAKAVAAKPANEQPAAGRTAKRKGAAKKPAAKRAAAKREKGKAVAAKRPAAKKVAAKKTAPRSQVARKAAPASARATGAKKPAVRTAKAGKVKAKRSGARSARRSTGQRGGRVARKQPQPPLPEIGEHEVLGIAARHLGTPYRRGGSSARGVDCSGFVRRVFSEVGLDVPHSARAQFSMGERVGADALQPGDLVFFRTRRRGASHVGIYAGDRLFIHAAFLGREVRVDSLDDHYYRTRYLGARRLRSES